MPRRGAGRASVRAGGDSEDTELRSPIQAVTGPGVEQLWSSATESAGTAGSGVNTWSPIHEVTGPGVEQPSVSVGSGRAARSANTWTSPAWKSPRLTGDSEFSSMLSVISLIVA